MAKPAPTLAQIAAQFTHHKEKSSGGYLVIDRRISNPVARLRHSRYRSLRALLLVKREGALENLWQYGAHETHAHERL